MVELDELIHRIQTDQQQRKHNQMHELLPLYIIHSNDDHQERSVSELSGNFLYSQLLIDCLIKITPTEDDKKELISLCKQHYHGNLTSLKLIKEFEREYSPDRALWWYTRNSFLCQMLNKALRVQDIHLLFLFRFIIRDIEQQLEKNKYSIPIRVYRAQLMSTEEVQMLEDSLGEFIAINSFFSTSLDRELALFYRADSAVSNFLERVFFEIDADPRLDYIKPFSDITKYSHFPEQKEVLFMVGSIFRLMNIDRDQDGILLVKMKLCSNNDHNLKALLHHMQKERADKEINLLKFAGLLEDMGKWDDAEKYYHRLLEKLPENLKDVACCYRGLGSIAKKKGDYESSLKWHEKSLQIRIRILKSDDPIIASSYLSIGNVYQEQKDYENALESYEKALMIYQRSFDENQLDVTICMDNISNSYRRKHQYKKALELYQQALSIREKHLPDDHVNLGRSHKNIGNIYADLSQYDLALAHLNLSLKIYKKSRPSEHPAIASTLANIGLVYENKKDFQQAMAYLEKAATIYLHSLSPTHPEVIQIRKELQRVSSKLK
jgi:tetratricopeptide (TPR) repeat protein